MAKKTPLRVLFVEDLPSDTELVVRELQKAKIYVTSVRVETKEAFLNALIDFNPEIVISDFALPGFDGLQALKSSLKYDPFLPFIVLTGSMNEDTAVACMKAGATDYVIKEHITRLPFAVKEALAQKNILKKKEAVEEELRKSEIKYRSIFENIQDVYYEVSLDGVILEMSPSIKFLSRGLYHREELIGKSILDIYIQPRIKEDFLKIIQEQGTILDYEVIFKNLDGSQIPCSITAKIQTNRKGTIEKIIGTVRDITQRKQTEILMEQRAHELAITQEAIIHSMAILAEFRDTKTGAHIQRTKLYVKLLLEKLGDRVDYPPMERELIWRSAPLHDIGKVGIPDGILLKPGKLTPDEFSQIKLHTVFGSYAIQSTEKILGPDSFLTFAQQIAEFHHEKWDGSGYPHGLKGEEIPFCARLMAIADVYDALISRRPYKEPIPHEEAVRIIQQDAGAHFEPLLVEIFREYHWEFHTIAKQYKEWDNFDNWEKLGS